MENFQVYRDIQARTGGDIYIGVVGACPHWKIHIYTKVYGTGGTSRNGGKKAGRSTGSVAIKRNR